MAIATAPVVVTMVGTALKPPKAGPSIPSAARALVKGPHVAVPPDALPEVDPPVWLFEGPPPPSDGSVGVVIGVPPSTEPSIEPMPPGIEPSVDPPASGPPDVPFPSGSPGVGSEPSGLGVEGLDPPLESGPPPSGGRVGM
jgi:hypothetical protein